MWHQHHQGQMLHIWVKRQTIRQNYHRQSLGVGPSIQAMFKVSWQSYRIAHNYGSWRRSLLPIACGLNCMQRLKELRHKDTCHTWLFHLNPLRGSVMTEGDYVINVQKRLGAKILSDECWCNICGKHIDPCLNHSEVCAIGEATRGHYAVVRTMVDGLKIADPAVTTEPRGLTRTQARPADIFTLLLSLDAARPWMCVWRLLMLVRQGLMRPNPPSVGSWSTIGTSSQSCTRLALPSDL